MKRSFWGMCPVSKTNMFYGEDDGVQKMEGGGGEMEEEEEEEADLPMMVT